MKALTTLMALSGRRPHVETGVLRSQVCTLLSPHRHDGQCRSTAVRIPMGLLYEHTHFMEGVALHIPLPVGLATAVQPAESGHLFWSVDGEQVPPETLPPCLHCILERGVAHVRHPVHGVVLGPTGRCYEEGLLGALSAAWSRVVEYETDRADTLRRAAAWLSECLQRPFGVAPEGLILFGRTSGELHPVSGIRDVDRLDVFEAMGCALDQMHRFGVFIGAGDVDDMIRDWSLAIGPRGGRQLVFTGFGDTFRGTPNRLGSQALASLARVSRGVAQNAGMRQMKELVWAYARRNRLNALDTSHLMDEVRTIPVATNLVIHPGIRRSQRIQEPA